jgi:pimeloyl-ACP methyl ester carboxylesterase
MPEVQLGEATIYYEEFGQGAPVLLLHGMMETGRMLAQLALRLSAHYRVILPDLRGYGRSGPRPRTFPTDFYRQDAGDMVALLRHLRITSTRILGTGDGAEVALLLAIAQPGLVRAIVAVDVTGALPASLLDMLPEIDSWVDAPGPGQLAQRAAAISAYGLDGVRAMWQGWKQAVRTLIAAGGNISLAQARAIRCPVLILNGTDDTLNTPAMSRALAAALPAAELRLVPNTAQLVYDKNMKNMRGVHDVITEWFQTH